MKGRSSCLPILSPARRKSPSVKRKIATTILFREEHLSKCPPQGPKKQKGKIVVAIFLRLGLLAKG